MSCLLYSYSLRLVETARPFWMHTFQCFCGQKAEELKAKGFDAYVILLWLEEETARPDLPADFAELRAMVWLANSAMKVLCSDSPWLSAEEQNHVSVVGGAFLRLFVAQCHKDVNCWRLGPKFHLLWHIFHEASLRPSGRSPALDATWMDEDWIKKVQKICKRCHKLTVSRTMLQRYLIGLHQKLQESKKQKVGSAVQKAWLTGGWKRWWLENCFFLVVWA